MRSRSRLPVLAVAATPVSAEGYSPSTPAEPAGGGLSMAQVSAILWAFRLHAVVIAALVIALTVFYVKVLPKTYSATATLLVNLGDSSDPLAGNQAQTVPLFNYMSTEVQLMQSAEVLLPVIERLHLTSIPYYTAGYRPSGGSIAEWAKERLAKDLEIEPGRAGSQLIYVTASARDPGLAAQIANTLVDIYLDQEKNRLSGPASERAKRYAQDLAELKDKVRIAQDQVTAFRQKTGVTDAAARNNSVEADLLASLEARLQEVQNARRAAEVKAASDQKVNAGAATSATVSALRTQLNNERAELAQLLVTLGEQHPKVVELKRQIEANQRNLDAEFDNSSAGANSDLTSARQLENKLRVAVEEQRNKVLGISRLQDEGTKYVLELESAQSVYKRALDGYDQIMFASGGHASNVNLVSRAVPPQLASKPNKVKLLLMGLLAAIALALAGPLAYELFVKRRIRCRDDFERSFSIPVLMEFEAIPAAKGAA